MPTIVVRHASEHNLKAIDVDIPHGRLTVVTGVSGSGKSSLVFDVVFREARRRYLETFSTRARHLLGRLGRPDVGLITGLSPAVAVSQRTTPAGARSTVGTLTGLHDDLRLFFARLGESPDGLLLSRRMFSFNTPEGACPACRGLGLEDRIDPGLLVADPAKSIRGGALALTTPNGYLIYSQVTMEVLDRVCRAHGFTVDIPWKDLTDEQRGVVLEGSDRILIPYGKHPLESRMRWTGITAKPREEGVYKGILPVMDAILRSKRNANILRWARTLSCRACGGRRLRPESLRVTVHGRSIADWSALSVRSLADDFRKAAFAPGEREVGESVREAVLNQTRVLERLGLGYLTLDREAASLSGGEYQRIRLAAQVGNGLRGLLYVLDEPTVGLHPDETARLLDILRELRDNGNTILVVEHDEDVIRAADHLLDLGPGPGQAGGRLLYAGPPEGLSALPKGTSPTRDYLAGDLRPEAPLPRSGRRGTIAVRKARLHNLRSIDVDFLLGALNVVTGVSGAGKSTLVKRILAARLREGRFGPGPDAEAVIVSGDAGRIVEIDASPIGRTPRSNPATYTGISDRIRDLFAALPEARARGWGKGRFSFNVPGGRCERCEGAGLLSLGMHFLGEVEIPCPECEGRRFKAETLEVRLRGQSIHDILEMSVAGASAFFSQEPRLRKDIEALDRLGLGYLKLGQSSATLSGGEAQRVKLASEWTRTGSGSAVYILEEPTTGLHRADVGNLLASLQDLVGRGHTVVAVEHHPDVIRAADRVVDLGPGSGEEGGRVVAAGSPGDIARCPESATGRALSRAAGSPPFPARAASRQGSAEGPIDLRGVSTHNLRDLDVCIPFRKWTVISGPSGSGKSSLAFDTLHALSQEKYLESFSAYVRAQIDKGGRADVASTHGLTAPVAVGRGVSSPHPRSTVGTMTEIYDLYRLLFSRAGELPAGRSERVLTASMFSFNHEEGACLVCKGLGLRTSADPERLITDPSLPLLGGALGGTKTGRFYGDPHGQYAALLLAAGREAVFDFSLPFSSLSPEARKLAMDGTGERIYDAVWTYKRGRRAGDFRFRGPWKGYIRLITDEYERKHADRRGEAMKVLMREDPCPACGGRRLKPESLEITFLGRDIARLSALSISESLAFFEAAGRLPSGNARTDAVSAAVLEDVRRRLDLVRDVGLDYLSVDRPSSNLSTGEARRLRLAGLLGVRLTGVTFILDEPTLGLHARDTGRLIGLIRNLQAEGNTVVAVEHDPDILRAADHILDLGPGGGRNGGRIIAEGPPDAVRERPESATGRMLAEDGAPRPPLPTRPGPGIEIRGASANNLKDLDVDIPAGVLTAVTGVSGSGKSSLLFDVLLRSSEAGKAIACRDIRGLDRFVRVAAVGSETPAGGSNSIPLTFLGLFDAIRGLFAATPGAQARGLTKAHFSYLNPEGRCPVCEGAGVRTVSMDFLADIATPCEACRGARYNPGVLDVRFKDRTIAEILSATVRESLDVFAGQPRIASGLGLLDEIGLDSVALGQTIDTLSGGEIQRLKLTAELMKPAPGPTLFLFDEPTAGLHAVDIERLLRLFTRLLQAGQTIAVVEHHLELIARAGHVIDLGPEGGERGGRLIIQGSPAEVAVHPDSHTGAALRRRAGLYQAG